MEKQLLEKYFSKQTIKEHLDSGFYSIISCHYCGNETFDSNFYCPHCGWSNDWTIARNAYSSVNGCTMEEFIPNPPDYSRLDEMK